VNLAMLFLIGAIVCFAVALLIAVGAFSSNDWDAWLSGGFLSYAISKVVP